MKNLLLALSSGILLALAWPTYGFPFLLFFAFIPLLYAEYKVRNSQKSYIKLKVLALSYISFLIWNIFTTYWLYNSTAFGGIFAITVNSLLMSVVFLIYHIVAKKTNFRASTAFLICIWIAFEKLHLGWEFSWPWLNLGNGFSEYPKIIQWYEYTGTFGGTLWIWLVNMAGFKLILTYVQFQQKEVIYRGALKILLIIGLPIGISLYLFNTYAEDKDKMEVVILQPNINPYTEKYNTNDSRIGQLLLELSEEKVTENTALIVAPETVFADGTVLSKFSNSEADYFSREILRKYPKTNFLSGISLYERFHDPRMVRKQSNQIGENDWYDDYNSAFLINGQDSTQLYHKSKLVVGVENFPYQSVLKPILGDVMIDLGGTVAMKTTQKDREAFALNNDKETAPIICYESVYGEYVTGYIKNGANFLSIITNDAWWGNTQGHKQHLSYARLRAIETRRSVVRSANTGISAFITPKGEITKSLAYEERGSIKSEITLNSEKTFYVRFGDYIARISILIGIIIFAFSFIKHTKSRK